MRPESRRRKGAGSSGEGLGKCSQGKCSFTCHLEDFWRGELGDSAHRHPRWKVQETEHYITSFCCSSGLDLTTPSWPQQAHPSISLGCPSLWVGRRTSLSGCLCVPYSALPILISIITSCPALLNLGWTTHICYWHIHTGKHTPSTRFSLKVQPTFTAQSQQLGAHSAAPARSWLHGPFIPLSHEDQSTSGFWKMATVPLLSWMRRIPVL